MSTPTHEVQLAIYDLSMGMARSMSASLLGPQHAVEIVPHTAIVAFGKEYFFGQGIEWCSPHEFRATRGIHPIEIQPLGHTTCTRQQFEDWCRAQAANGNFGMQSYDLIHKNCNNFSEEAARNGLRLQKGVPQWILELPQKLLSSPMGMMMRPMLEQMQLSNAPTNMPAGAGSVRMTPNTSSFSPSSPAPAAAASNPWANIPAATPATQPTATPNQTTTGASTTSKSLKSTPLLDKQTSLLSTDTGVVKICIDRLKPEKEQTELLSKLSDTKSSWKQEDIDSVHHYLRSVIENDSQHLSFALMLLRLAVLRDVSANEESSQSTELLASMLLEGKLSSLSHRSMAWCVLSNAMGSKSPDWIASAGTESDKFHQLIDRALSHIDASKDGASSQSQVSLRQSASAFVYNSSRYLAIGNDVPDNAAADGSAELSEGTMSILIGCLEHLAEETDATTVQRLYMAIGQLLKSLKFGKTAVNLVRDLGLMDGEIGKGHTKDVEGLAKEVAALLE